MTNGVVRYATPKLGGYVVLTALGLLASLIFARPELAATLRSTDPDRAREVCDTWREIALGVHRQECSIYQAATAGSQP